MKYIRLIEKTQFNVSSPKVNSVNAILSKISIGIYS